MDDDTSLPRQRRVLGVLSPDQERTIRFVVGVGLLIHQFGFTQGRPNMLAIAIGAVMSGTPLTNIADELFKAGRRKDDT